MTAKLLDERDVARLHAPEVTFRTDDIARSVEFRKLYETLPNVVTAEQMPLERSPDGLIKHLVHRKMNTRELCIEAYMQFLEDGERSGRHRHMWEEIIFVLEGTGYDLHWDLTFDCDVEFSWEWAKEPKKYEWKKGDFIYIPPYTDHQHFGTAPGTRLIVISNPVVKDMGFDWFDQIERAPGF
jgi:quercetin dioxygenase-like cupin family protein